MHEWGLSRRLLKLVEDEARARQLSRVSRVRLETSILSVAEREALCFNFQAAARGTVAEDAVLDIDEHPLKAMCSACLNEVLVNHRDQACPQCGARPLAPIGGDLLRITELVAT